MASEEEGREEQQHKRFGFWFESDDYYQATPYEDGDINFEMTEEQARSAIETLETGIEKLNEDPDE